MSEFKELELAEAYELAKFWGRVPEDWDEVNPVRGVDVLKYEKDNLIAFGVLKLQFMRANEVYGVEDDEDVETPLREFADPTKLPHCFRLKRCGREYLVRTLGLKRAGEIFRLT